MQQSGGLLLSTDPDSTRYDHQEEIDRIPNERMVTMAAAITNSKGSQKN